MKEIPASLWNSLDEEEQWLFTYLSQYFLDEKFEAHKDFGSYVYLNNTIQLHKKGEYFVTGICLAFGVEADIDEYYEEYICLPKNVLDYRGWGFAEKIDYNFDLVSPDKQGLTNHQKIILAGFIEKALKLDLGIAPIIKAEFPAFNNLEFRLRSYEFIQFLFGKEIINPLLVFMDSVNDIKNKRDI
jgi:hypothetical protein